MIYMPLLLLFKKSFLHLMRLNEKAVPFFLFFVYDSHSLFRWIFGERAVMMGFFLRRWTCMRHARRIEWCNVLKVKEIGKKIDKSLTLRKVDYTLKKV